MANKDYCKIGPEGMACCETNCELIQMLTERIALMRRLEDDMNANIARQDYIISVQASTITKLKLQKNKKN